MYIIYILYVCVNHLHRCKTSTLLSRLTFCRKHSVSRLTSTILILQGVVAGSRAYHQRRRSGFLGDTWLVKPCVPAISNLSSMATGQAKNRHVAVFGWVQLLHAFRNLKPVDQFILCVYFIWIFIWTLQSIIQNQLPIHTFPPLSGKLDCLCTGDTLHTPIRKYLSEQVCYSCRLDKMTWALRGIPV